MKQPKRPTREQKEILSENGLVPGNWMVLEEDREETVFVSRRSGQRRAIKKWDRQDGRKRRKSQKGRKIQKTASQT